MNSHNFECLLTGDLDKKHFMRKMMGSQSRVVEDRSTSEELENVLCKRPFQEITKEEDQGNKVE